MASEFMNREGSAGRHSCPAASITSWVAEKGDGDLGGDRRNLTGI